MPVEKTSESRPFPPFPQDLYECFIDACADLLSIQRDTYALLCACCLTSRAWYPRSRLNLYKHIKIVTAPQFDDFLSTLHQSPHYGEYVRRLSIAIDIIKPGGFLPAAMVLTMLSCKLNNLRSIDVAYSPFRPDADFYANAPQFRGVSSLFLSGYTFRSSEELVKFITLFPLLSTLKVVFDDYDPPRPTTLPDALDEVTLAHLTTFQIEILQTDPYLGPSVLGGRNLVEWLERSSTARNLRRLWVVFTIEATQETYEVTGVLNGLLRACGGSLQELIITVQSFEVGEDEILNNLNGLTLCHSSSLRSLHLLRLPWGVLPRPLPSVIASSSSRSLEAITLSFLSNEQCKFSDIVRPTGHEYAAFVDMDTTLSNRDNYPRFRNLNVDMNDTVNVNSGMRLLQNVPCLHSQGLVNLTTVNERVLRQQWGLP